MAPQVPVVVVVDDDDAPASPPTRRRRSRATPPPAAANSPDSLDAFSTSPPLPKRRAPATPIVLDDDTPPPPKRRASEGPPEPPGSVVPETPQSFVPCSLGPGPGPRAAVAETTLDSVLPCSFRFDFDADVSEIRGSAVPCGIDPDIAIAETPGFTTTRSVGPATAPGFPPAASPQKLSGASCPISLDSDDELDDIGYREPLTKLPSNTAKSEPMIRPGTSSCLQNNGGKINFGQHPHAGLPCEDSTLKEEEKHDKEENPRLIEERKKKQEEKRLKKEEKVKSIEEKKRQREENKLLKEANKVQKAEQKKYAKEKEDWGSGKHALKSIVVEIDSTIIETGSVAGILLTRFAEKDLKYRVKANSIRGSILWKMEVPQIGQDPASVSEVPYILFVIQAEKFCDLISSGSFFDHVLDVRSRYPTFTICYVTNKLMNYITKCERHQYKNPSSSNSWQRPPVEEVLCKLATHYVRVHSRQCADEAEVADHVVGLTSSLANCKFRKPLTWLSVHANGAMIPKNFIDKDLAKKDTWMKALIAIPKVQPRFALAIWKTYPTMRSLLNVYMDPSKTDHEKELLLKDLKCEDRLGDESRRVGPKCSRRVYKILMAQNGATDADDAE